MKINPGQTRSLDRTLDKQLGTGTSILSEGAAVILLPGAKDQIQLSQQGNRLQVLVNDSEKFLLTERESQNFDIRGDQKNVTIDPSVSLFSKQQKVTSGDPHAPLPGIPAERGEQLGHARRVEGAFETAVTRKTLTDDLKEDAFVNHLGKQMQRLLGEMGGAIPQQTAFRTEKDLVPFLTQLENLSGKGAIPLSRDFQQDLNRTVKKIQQEIKDGGAVELEFLGFQITLGLKQINDSKGTASTPMQAGRIPFEAHELPIGGSLKEAFQKWGSINEAITKNDIGLIREFAGHPSLLKLALPAEKAAFVSALSKHILSPGIPDADKTLTLQNIVQILQSAQNTKEFRGILDMAGLEKVQEAVKEAPAEFNITAHLFQAAELALDPNHPPFIANQYLQGFNLPQIFTARQQILLGPQDQPPQALPWSAVNGARFSENPLLTATAAPEEKASMIQALQTGYVSVTDERSIINILQSAMNKPEFERIVDSAGGKAIGLALQDPVSLLQWNRLAGAYDRMDLTTDFVEGVKHSGTLLEPFPFESPKAVSLLPLQAPSILRDQSVRDVANTIDTFMKTAGSWIGNQIGVLDRRAYVQTGIENVNRTMEGLPVLDIPLMRNQLDAILQQPNLQPQQILDHLQNVASTTGLGGYELRNLVSQPLAFVYQTAAGEAETLVRNTIAFLQENLQLSQFHYGPKSPQARLVEGQMDRVQTTLLPFAERLRTISNILSEAFPPPVDLPLSLSKFASVLQQNFSPIVSNVLPNFPALMSQILDNARSIQTTVTGESQISPATATPPANITPAISQFPLQLTTVMKGIDMIRNGNLARQFSEVSQDLARLPGVPPDLIQFAKQVTSFLSAIQDGTYAKTLKEVAANLKKYDDPIAELAKTTAENGALFLTQLQNGTLTKVQEDFVKELNKFQNDPEVTILHKFLEKITSLTNGILQDAISPKTNDEAAELITEISGGGLGNALTNIGQAAARFRESPVFRNLMDLMERGGKFLTALHNGNFAQNMELMNSRFGYSPAVAQVIERGLHLTTTSSSAVKTLVGRDFERPIAQITRKAQAKTEAAKEIVNAQTIFSSASTFFYALTDVENMDLLWQYHRQLGLLKDEVLIDSSIRQFEKEAQLLAAEPDFKKSLQNQLSSFQSARTRNSKT